jgi:HAE1 family hydrophobic/amphiphilic exporter-1
MFVLFFIALGIVSFPKMNVERTPLVDFPMVTATFVYPGAAPAEIESQVIKKAEYAISEVSGLKKITSQAFENGGFVMAEFNLGVNVNDKSSEIKAKLDAILSEFPDDLKQPVVEKLNILQQSVVDIVLTGANLRDMKEYVKDILSTRITAIPGIASVSVFGGEERAVRIEMNPELMASRGVTIMDIVSALGNRNLNVPGGKLESLTDSSAVRFIGEFQNIDDIKNLRITTVEGDKFMLHDVATVTDTARDIETGARYNGENVVIASVVKSSDGNAVKISRALNKKMPEFQQDLESRFQGAEMKIVTDTSTAISDETNDTIWGIIMGILFTVIILMLFTKNWRSTIIAAVVIPASLIAGFFFMQLSGFTINMLTLLAYSSALGTLISNAIILIESALQEMAAGKSPEDSAIDSTKKVAMPILAGVGTNVVVFLPLAFMGGIAGQFMNQFGMTIVYVTLLSLLVSFTLTPMMIAVFLRPSKKTGVNIKNEKLKEARAKKEADASRKDFMTGYRGWFDYQAKHPWRVLGIAIIVFIASAALMKFVGSEFQPGSDVDEITVTARVPMGSTYIKSESIARQIEEKLAEFPEVNATSVKIGERGLQNMSVKVKLIDKERRVSDKALMQKMLPKLAEIPDAEIQIKAGESMAGAGINSDIVLHIFGEDDAKREAYAKQILNAINNIPEVQSAVLAQQEPGMEIRFIPDDKKMNFWGVRNAYAGSSLRTALFGNDNYKYKESGKEYPIILEFARPFKNQEIFDNVYVNSQKGLVPLSELGVVENGHATSNISRINKNRLTEIDINIGKSTMGPVQLKIESEIAKIDWEFGYRAEFGGMSEIQGETNNEMSSTFLLAVVLTFMLLAAILNSVAHPFTIATSILTSFAGVFILLFLSGASMNIAAMLSIIMLVGLVVNNNILILEPTVNRIASGENPVKALWTELVDKKSMILMTSIAIIAGMLPQLLSGNGMKTAMSAVLIGGMTASLVWTFALTPALFFVIEKLRTRLSKKK